ncbi:MAG TPA: GNAT family N-acetyltransferase [Xanthobacteraceae bacterium]|jgi:GNAT superfamily N-acetyltransferase
MTSADAISIRPLGSHDSIDALTALLHRAYAALAAKGWNYTAVDQSVDVTRERVAQGACLVAVDGQSRIVGTITYDPPEISYDGSPWLCRPDVAHLAQFGVEPLRQGGGIGARLMAAVEGMARTDGAREIALDTAEPAMHLVEWYARCGYRFIEYVQWRGKRYRSVIMSKAL